MTIDQRDPRASTTCWPCFGDHSSCVKGSNKYATWQHCAKRGVRTRYVPRVGAPGNHQQTMLPLHVEKALAMLKKDIPKDQTPNMNMVTRAIEVIRAQELYIQEPLVKEKSPRPSTSLTPPPKAKALFPTSPAVETIRRGLGSAHHQSQ